MGNTVEQLMSTVFPCWKTFRFCVIDVRYFWNTGVGFTVAILCVCKYV